MIKISVSGHPDFSFNKFREEWNKQHPEQTHMTIDLIGLDGQPMQHTWQMQATQFIVQTVQMQKSVMQSSLHLLANAFDEIAERLNAERSTVPSTVFKMTLMLDKTAFERQLRKNVIKEEELKMIVNIAQLSGLWLIWDGPNWIPIRMDEFISSMEDNTANSTLYR